jgi:secreted PhoX family phosphatase
LKHKNHIAMKTFYTLLLCGLFSCLCQAQQTFSTRISAANDDLEEFLPGSVKTAGTLDAGSSDLELGAESAGNVDPQLCGMRFTNITIPKGAIITNAYIRFTVDATGKNTDPCNLHIFAQAADNPVTFDPAVNFNLSSRPRLADSIAWNVATGSWSTVGQSGADQTSTNIGALVQQLINRNGWASGNAMAFFIKGTGLREAESFDKSATNCPQLVIEYLAPSVLTKRIVAANDDLEEYIPGTGQTKTLGSMDAGSSDLELGAESAGNVDPQLIGMRFTDLAIPKNSRILNAYIQFTVDATNKNTDPTNLQIFAQDADNPVTFDPATPFNISSRPRLTDSIAWNIPTGSWATVGQAGADQRSTNIAALVQKLVNRNAWTSGNSMAFFITGKGLREAESFDKSATNCAQLIIEYIPTAILSKRIAAANDDLEEYIPGTGQTKTLGSMDAGSSDLELGAETAGNIDPQLVGMRFTGIDLPKNAIVTNAYIQFTVDATGKNTDPTNLQIFAQDADNPVTFDPATPFNISSRPRLTDSIAWNIPTGSWATVGQASADQRSSNIAALVNKLVARNGWQKGNSMAFFMTGKGLREAESYDKSATNCPQLVIEYLSSNGGPTIVETNPVTTYPIKSASFWNYFDKGGAPTGDWKTKVYNDTTWAFSKGALGYGSKDIFTSVSFGTDSTKKHVTTYFRKRFEIKTQSEIADSIQLSLRADDGAVVYVNGTEVTRVNMPTGAVVDTTLATKEVGNPDELLYYIYDIAGSVLQVGQNVIAVEIHQNARNGKDIAFDLKLGNRSPKNAANLGCRDANDKHVGCFTSVSPTSQLDTITIPRQHGFQYVIASQTPYIGATGNVSTNFDFTGYVPLNNSSRQGYLSINYETGAGGVAVGNIRFTSEDGLWKVDSIKPVNFAPVVRTQANCSGTVTPWGTVITSEESTNTTDSNADGYFDIGWNVEIDPATKTVVRGQKLWAIGRMSHENVVVHSDRKTVYQGEDDGSGCVYKFIADAEANLSSGKLYALKLTALTTDSTIPTYKNFTAAGEPVGSVGTWIEIPNTTIAERNAVKAKAVALGATLFNGVEDVEISPIDGKIYFAVKSNPFNRVYRFKDNGTTLSEFETFAGGSATNYRINTGGKEIDEDWGVGNDNLTFDDRGNLWVLQDGSRNHIWIVRPNHTQASPKVEVFMLSPNGSEPTGMTFTPDYRYMFLSIQEPSGANTTVQKDISGKEDKFNRSHALVIARREYLGQRQTSTAEISDKIKATAYPNPSTAETNVVIDLKETATIQLSVFDISGRLITQTPTQQAVTGQFQQAFNLPTAGIYFIRITANGSSKVLRVVKM